MSERVQLLLGASGGIGSALTRRLTARGDIVLASELPVASVCRKNR